MPLGTCNAILDNQSWVSSQATSGTLEMKTFQGRIRAQSSTLNPPDVIQDPYTLYRSPLEMYGIYWDL